MDSIPASPPVSTDTPLLVGRERELGEIERSLTSTLAGRGRIVLVSGEAGIGKSTLVASLRRAADEQQVLVLSGHCYDLTATPPYGPWIGVIQSYDRQRQQQPHLPDIPNELMPGTPLTNIQMQSQLFDAVFTFLNAVAREQPLLIVLEDLHWSDPASVEMLRDVARRVHTVERTRIMIVATFRENELGIEHPLYQHRPGLVREADALRIELHRLDPNALDTLIRARYVLSPADSTRLHGWLARMSEGNPFYALELLRSLESTGLLTMDGTGWQFGDPAGSRTPDLIRQVIDTRLAQLDEDARRALQIASVIGEEVPFDLWLRVGGQPEEAMIDAYERADRLQILAESASGQGFQFSHALIRQALYESIASPRRRLWHRQLGEALETMPGIAPDTVAWHYQQGGDERAIAWLVRAGNRAQMAYAWRTAIERLQAAADLLAGYPARLTERGWLLFRLGSMYRFSDVPTARRYFDEASEIADASGDSALAAYTTYARATARINSGDVRGGLPVLERAIDLLMTMPQPDRDRLNATPGVFSPRAVPDFDSTGIPAPAQHIQHESLSSTMTVGDIDRHGVLAMLLAATGQAQRALEIVANGLEHLPDDHLADRRFSGHLHRAAGQALGLLGDIDRADEAHRLSCRIFEGADLHLEQLQSTVAYLETVIDTYRLDDVERRRYLLAETRESGARAEAAFPAGITCRHLVLSDLLLDGSWDKVAELVASDGIETGQFLIVHGIHAAAGWLAWNQGNIDEAWRHVRSIFPRGPQTDPGDAVLLPAVMLMRVAVGLAIESHALDDARSWLECLDRWLDWSGTVIGKAESRIDWATWHLAMGDVLTARRLASEAIELAESPRRPLPLIEASRLAGRIATAMKRFGEARSYLDTSGMLARDCALPFELALTQIEQGELSLAVGDQVTAEETLREARSTLERLNARPHIDRAMKLEGRLREPIAPLAYPAGLSRREVEVLRLVASGMTDAETAEALSISPRTVGQHLRSIYNKLGVSSRVAASRFAIEHGLV